MAKTNWEGSELRLERDGNDLLLHMGGITKPPFRRGDFADFHQRFSLVPRRCAGKYVFSAG